MIELYHNDTSVCAQKVRFALAEKQLSWESHHLNLRAGDQQQPEYLKLNANALVPTLVDNGTVIIESTVINEYLDDTYPQAALKPMDGAGRARMRLWTKQLDESVHAATSVVSSAIAFRYQKLAIGMEAVAEFLQKMPDPVKREKSCENLPAFIRDMFPTSSCFDKLVSNEKRRFASLPWLAVTDFHWRISAMPLTLPCSIIFNCNSSVTSVLTFPSVTIACASAPPTAKR